ncbi:unnamed protein product [Paramecium octaurelia]|uniref:Uncharacterized protein n=1 Tax=Paramecium octaurelia TaxID=43137 RepID=A0A8S1Y874_PAROT|nr:unnamed protein product [Paramecium octaurelia]
MSKNNIRLQTHNLTDKLDFNRQQPYMTKEKNRLIAIQLDFLQQAQQYQINQLITHLIFKNNNYKKQWFEFHINRRR